MGHAELNHAFGHRHKILKAVKEKLSGLPELGKWILYKNLLRLSDKKTEAELKSFFSFLNPQTKTSRPKQYSKQEKREKACRQVPCGLGSASDWVKHDCGSYWLS